MYLWMRRIMFICLVFHVENLYIISDAMPVIAIGKMNTMKREPMKECGLFISKT